MKRVFLMLAFIVVFMFAMASMAPETTVTEKAKRTVVAQTSLTQTTDTQTAVVKKSDLTNQAQMATREKIATAEMRTSVSGGGYAKTGSADTKFIGRRNFVAMTRAPGEMVSASEMVAVVLI